MFEKSYCGYVVVPIDRYNSLIAAETELRILEAAIGNDKGLWLGGVYKSLKQARSADFGEEEGKSE